MYGTHLAAEIGSTAILDFLLIQSADLFAVTVSGNTALHIAARRNQVECAKLILRHANTSWEIIRLLWLNISFPGNSLLDLLPKDVIGEISLKLSQMCDVGNSLLTLRNSQRQTPLEYAIKTRSEKVITHLISPFTAHLKSNMGSLLHQAADGGSPSACAALLNHGYSVDCLNSRGETPLYRACCTYPESPATVKVLLEHNADISIPDMLGKTALNMAESRKYWECAKLIKQYQGNQVK
eukprot:TRINITY_DN6741_c0_g1_i2.p1 TRINITY_DN6741_c0_g1~~TRINITY_DN6741_c0_g1_i2.p1  ORF type:complete len:239 (+),score=9.09 TRINITY_DN6741_c0_g1_i2:211-927(+)